MERCKEHGQQQQHMHDEATTTVGEVVLTPSENSEKECKTHA